MKSIFKLLSAIVVAGAMLGSTATHATVITNTWDPTDVVITNNSSYSYVHNLNPALNALLAGGGTYQFASALLDVYLRDPQGGLEKIQFTIGSGNATQVFTGQGNNQVPNGNNDTQYPIVLTSALPDLQDDGILNILLQVTPGVGNYIFDKSVLIADVNVVPEPSSVALFAICLLAVAASCRKKASR